MKHLTFGRVLLAVTLAVAAASIRQQDPTSSTPMHVLLPHIRTIPQRANVLGYTREAFGPGWAHLGNGCTTRDTALRHALIDVPPEQCPVTAGTGTDPYSGIRIGVHTEAAIELDHVYPLRAAWDMGAHQWSAEQRIRFANDPQNLIVVSKQQNQAKSDQLPSEWMPPAHQNRCWYARRVAKVAATWRLPLTPADTATMHNACAVRELFPSQLRLPFETPKN